MAQLSVPSSPKLKYTYYTNLKGLDLSHIPIEVDRQHASDMLNMMPDYEDGIPVKRKGWRNIQKFGAPIRYAYHDEYDDFNLVATYDGVFFDTGNYEFDTIHISPGAHAHFHHSNGLVYLICTDGLWTIDKDKKTEKVTPYVPTTVISRNPDGTGGEDYEGVNALTDERRIQFYCDPSTYSSDNLPKEYKIYPTTDHEINVSKVEYMADSGWTEMSGWQFARSEMSLLFDTAPSASQSGRDNIRVTFTEERSDNLYKNLLNSDVTSSDDDRLFVVVDNNKIYYSEAGDFSYIADDNYVVAGNDAPIMGLHKRNGYLYAVTKSSSEHSVFVLQEQTVTVNKTVIQSDWTTSTETEQIAYYSVESSVAGTGAIARKSFATLVDDPLFLGDDGIMSIGNEKLTSNTFLVNRSSYINKRLNAEPNRENAIATQFMGNFILAVNGHCYVLDSRNTYRDTAKNVGYEGYYWDLNLQDGEYITTFLAYDEDLFFGTSTGKWCKYNNDIEGMSAYCDDGTFNEDGSIVNPKAIHAYYTTCLDDDNLPQYFKTTQKKGCVVTLKPFENSRLEVYYSKDGQPKQPLVQFTSSIFSWNHIDFSKFSFISSAVERDCFIRKKIKKYIRLSYTFENKEIYQGMGIAQFTKTWVSGNFSKGK